MKNDLQQAPPPPDSAYSRMAYFLIPAMIMVTVLMFMRKKTEEDVIREMIDATAQAARDRHPANFSSHLTEDFKTVHELGKDELHQVLTRMLMFQYKEVQVTLPPTAIPVAIDAQDPNKASATFKAVVVARTAPDAQWESLTDQAGGTVFKCQLKKSADKGWQFSKVDVEKEK